MTEIEKMFENAGIKKAPDVNNCFPEMMKCHHCEYYKVINEYTGRCLNEVYPDFTAEKQLKIAKFLLRKGDYYDTDDVYYDTDGDTYWFHFTDEIENATYRPFEEAIAEFINTLWQSLTDQEKEEIRNILNENS